jgi:hypothetical protein
MNETASPSPEPLRIDIEPKATLRLRAAELLILGERMSLGYRGSFPVFRSLVAALCGGGGMAPQRLPWRERLSSDPDRVVELEVGISQIKGLIQGTKNLKTRPRPASEDALCRRLRGELKQLHEDLSERLQAQGTVADEPGPEPAPQALSELLLS